VKKLYRGPYIDAFYQVWFHLAQLFQRRRLKCEKLMDGRQLMAISHMALWARWAKTWECRKGVYNLYIYSLQLHYIYREKTQYSRTCTIWHLSCPTSLWHPTKIYGPKVFLLTNIKPEYSDILYNPTYFPGPFVSITSSMHLVERWRMYYNQTCIKRSPLGQRKSGLIREVTS
jgi:hypothetical protein